MDLESAAPDSEVNPLLQTCLWRKKSGSSIYELPCKGRGNMYVVLPFLVHSSCQNSESFQHSFLLPVTVRRPCSSSARIDFVIFVYWNCDGERRNNSRLVG